MTASQVFLTVVTAVILALTIRRRLNMFGPAGAHFEATKFRGRLMEMSVVGVVLTILVRFAPAPENPMIRKVFNSFSGVTIGFVILFAFTAAIAEYVKRRHLRPAEEEDARNHAAIERMKAERTP